MLTLADHLGSSPEFVDWANPVNRAHPLNRDLLAWFLAVPNRAGFGSNKWRDLCKTNDATLTNMDPATDWRGHFGRPGGYACVDFDGSNDHCLNSSPTASLNGMSTLTVTFWMRTAALRNFHVPMSKGTYNTGYGFYLDTAPNLGLAFNCKTAGGGTHERRVSTSNFPTGRWVPCAGVYDGSLLRIYQDGKAQTTTVSVGTAPSGVVDASGTLYLGTDTGATSYLLGQLDSVRIYRRALSAVEVAILKQVESSNPGELLNRIPLPFPMQQAAAAGGLAALIGAGFGGQHYIIGG